MKDKLVSAGAYIAYSVFMTACGYIAGHSVCAYQHVSTAEDDRMLRDKNGNISNTKYIIEAFKDLKRVYDDPLGQKVDPL